MPVRIAGALPLLGAAVLMIGAGLMRYLEMPSFWLDEAYVAVTIRNPSVETIFARLEYGQFFPRLYLGTIAVIRHLAGYQIWSLRLLPFLFFVAATALWARLLFKHSRSRLVLIFLAASFLLGSIFWLDQGIQLKQYTLDVLVALAPFLISDDLLDEMNRGDRKIMVVLLAVPCLFSYTYPIALSARLLGWYAIRAGAGRWRLRIGPLIILAAFVSTALVVLWLTDLRFNALDKQAYTTYWSDCILKNSFQRSFVSGMRLLARFLWGWHGREPIVTAFAVPLQAIGFWSIAQRFKTARMRDSQDGFDAILVGSAILLLSLIAVSAAGLYPICAGRVILFAQVHIQLITIEGAAFLLRRWPASRVSLAVVIVAAAAVLAHSVRDYTRFARSEPAENIRATIKLIDPAIADRLWVHPCSIPQVRSLPDPLPVSELLLGDNKEQTKSALRAGERVWILWSHLGTASCLDELQRIRSRAKNWTLVDEGPARGLALAEF